MKRKTYPELAAEYGVARSTLTIWRKDGVDVHDPAAVARYRAGLVGEDRSDKAQPPSVNEARRLKLLKETEKLEIQIAKELGNLIPKEQVTGTFVAIAVVIKQGLMRLENDLPPQLEGLTAGAMKKVIRETLRNQLAEWEKYARDGLAEVEGE